MSKAWVVIAAAITVAGCAAAGSDPRAAALRAQFEQTVPVCESRAQCEKEWAAARRWVLDHAGFRIQTMTDTYIETFNNAYQAETSTWARVTMDPLGDTRHRILIELGCNNWFHCSLSPLIQAQLDFNQTVSAAGR